MTGKKIKDFQVSMAKSEEHAYTARKVLYSKPRKKRERIGKKSAEDCDIKLTCESVIKTVRLKISQLSKQLMFANKL